MRITLLTEYYVPERGAAQTRLRETVKHLVDAGAQVTVVTCAPHYPDGFVHPGYTAWRPTRERLDGATVIRLPVLARPNRGMIDRVLDQVSYAFTVLAAAPIIARSDVFIVESPPLFLGVSARILSRLTRVPYLLHVADLWPDILISAGALNGRLPIALGHWMARVANTGATLITTVTPPIVERIERKPGAAGKVRLLPNAVDVTRFDPTTPPPEARATLGWSETFTLVYAGTVGIVHGVGTLLDAAALLPPERGIRIHIVGAGMEFDSLRERAAAEGLTAVEFHPSVDPAQVPTVLAAADAIVVLLRDGPMYEETLPAKLLEGLACGRPVIIGAAGHPATLVADNHAGIVVPPEDPARLAQAILDMEADPERGRYADAGRRLATESFSRTRIVARLLGYLRECVATAGSRGSAAVRGDAPIGDAAGVTGHADDR